jgi:hypothetical protein
MIRQGFPEVCQPSRIKSGASPEPLHQKVISASIEGPQVDDIMKQHNKVVMFADLLGFALLTEQHELDAISTSG